MSKFNYFAEISVDGYDFPVIPQVNFGFISQGFALLSRSAHDIEYSFDGTNVHGDLAVADPSRGIIFDFRQECKIWLRAAPGTGRGYGVCRVEAWAK